MSKKNIQKKTEKYPPVVKEIYLPYCFMSLLIHSLGFFCTENKLKDLEDFCSFIVLPYSGTVIKGSKILPHFSVREAAQYK